MCGIPSWPRASTLKLCVSFFLPLFCCSTDSSLLTLTPQSSSARSVVTRGKRKHACLLPGSDPQGKKQTSTTTTAALCVTFSCCSLLPLFLYSSPLPACLTVLAVTEMFRRAALTSFPPSPLLFSPTFLIESLPACLEIASRKLFLVFLSSYGVCVRLCVPKYVCRLYVKSTSIAAFV